MTAKEYLSQAIYLRSKIRRADELIAEIHLKAENAGGIRYDKPSIMSSPTNDKLINYMADLEQAEAKSRNLRAEYYHTYSVIRDQIDQIQPQLYSELLALRYLDGLDLSKISTILRYSYDRIKHLHGLALNTFDRQFLKDSTQ